MVNRRTELKLASCGNGVIDGSDDTLKVRAKGAGCSSIRVDYDFLKIPFIKFLASQKSQKIQAAF